MSFSEFQVCAQGRGCQASTELERALASSTQPTQGLSSQTCLGGNRKQGAVPGALEAAHTWDLGAGEAEVVLTSTGCSFPPLGSLFFPFCVGKTWHCL